MWMSCTSVLLEYFWLHVNDVNDENLMELLELYPCDIVEIPGKCNMLC